MDVSTIATAAPANNNASANNVNQNKETGKQEIPSAPSYAPKEEDSTNPQDSVEISDAAKAEQDKIQDKVNGKWKDFDMDAFQGGIRDTLMQSINESRKKLEEAGVEFAGADGDSILYDLTGLNGGKEVKAAEVPEYWNAENTASRIVDFAMSFRDLAPELTDEEYVEQVRSAVQKGFSLAKSDIGSLPGPSAQLFNDTYNTAMKKFDDILEQSKNGNSPMANASISVNA